MSNKVDNFREYTELSPLLHIDRWLIAVNYMSRWSRSLTKSMGSTADFIKGLKAALADEDIIETLTSTMSRTICTPLLKQIEDLREIIQGKEEKICQLEKHIQDLEVTCDDLEQYSRRNSLRIFGFPEEHGENLLEAVPEFLNKELQIQPPIQSTDICRVHRTGRKTQDSRPRPCIVKLISYQKRDIIYKRRSKLRHSSHTVYVNEDLTKRRSHMLWKARQAKKQKAILDTWTFDGKLFVKTLDNKIEIVNRMSQLEHYGVRQ